MYTNILPTSVKCFPINAKRANVRVNLEDFKLVNFTVTTKVNL